MFKIFVSLILVPICLSYYIPISIEFMGNKPRTLAYDLTTRNDQQGLCATHINAWNSWPGGVTGSIIVHGESDPSIETWVAILAFDKDVEFKTYDGTVDKSEGKKFTVTPVSWNGPTQAGSQRVLNFQLKFEGDEPKLVSLTLNGGEEVRCVEAEAKPEEKPETVPEVSPVAEEIIPINDQNNKVAPTENQRGVYVPWPKKVMGIYILLADDDHEGFESNAVWEPRLYDYQQKGANVLFFTFIHPQTMEIPPAFESLAKTRGKNEEGAIPEKTVIIFAIGGYAYSVKQNPWNWLTSKEAAEAMAVKVAEWPSKYNCDGIDLDLEDGAGNRKEAGPNMVHFIKKLRELVPNMIISQPTYGYPQIDAENDVINESWDVDGNSKNVADSVGLMVYEGSQSLNYVKNFVNGADQWQGFPIKVRTPSDTILLGAKGASSAATFEELSNAAIQNNYRGIMVWYASVKNGPSGKGLQYAVSWDASEDKGAQDAYINVMTKFSS